jgi:hypothetical protein
LIHQGNAFGRAAPAPGPRFEKHGEETALLGHDHLYSRSHKIAQGRIVDPAAPGVIYAISVSGPKMYEIDERNGKLMAKVVDQTQCFQVIEVAANRLKYTAQAADGALVDGFELQKNGKDSTYVNRAPVS